VNVFFGGIVFGLGDLFRTRSGFREKLDLSRFAHHGSLVRQASRSSRQPPATSAIWQSQLNITQQTVHYALQWNVLDRGDADQFYRTFEVRKSHPRDPTFAAMPGVDMCRAMIVGKDVNPGSCARRYAHATHRIDYPIGLGYSINSLCH
jgi:hypothetical protein